MLELIKKLCSANAPSGCEDEVIRIITSRLDELCVPHVVYPSGNVIASLISDKENAPKIMVQCHVDEVGFMVKAHRDGGYMSISPLGITVTTELVGKRVALLSDERFHGSIGAVPIHLSKNKDVPEMDDLYADVGIMSKTEAEEKVPLGSFGCFDTEIECFGKNDSFISGKALSSRIPCAVMLEAISKLKETELNAQIDFAFTVRGNLSLGGATEAYNKTHPDAVIHVAGVDTSDTPDNSSPICRLDHGAALSKGEIRHPYDKTITEQLYSKATTHGIPLQFSRPMTDDEDRDFDTLRMKNAGARLSVVKLPLRRMNSCCEVASMSDVRAVTDLLCSALPVLEV